MLRSVVPNSGLARAANLLIELYGTNASAFASRRAKRALDEKNLDGATTWLRVLVAIQEQTGPHRRVQSSAWR